MLLVHTISKSSKKFICPFAFAVSSRCSFVLFVSSSFSFSSSEPDDDEVLASAFARSICSAMRLRSRCSSDVVRRSFFCAASYRQGKEVDE